MIVGCGGARLLLGQAIMNLELLEHLAGVVWSAGVFRSGLALASEPVSRVSSAVPRPNEVY